MRYNILDINENLVVSNVTKESAMQWIGDRRGYLLEEILCNDVDGNTLHEGDSVVVLDCLDLEGDAPNRGDILTVSECSDAESNYIKFNDGKYGFFGHRVLKVRL